MSISKILSKYMALLLIFLMFFTNPVYISAVHAANTEETKTAEENPLTLMEDKSTAGATATADSNKDGGHLTDKEKALNFSNSLLEYYLQKEKAKGPAWLKSTDINFRLTEDHKPVYSLETLQPFGEVSKSGQLWFWQGRYDHSSAQSSTANVGLGWRKLSQDKSSIVGFNAFYDYGFQYNLARIGVGGEYFNKLAEYRFNLYHPVSGERQTAVSYLGSGISYSYIRAVEGVDFEMGTSLEHARWMKFFLGGYYYDNKYNTDEIGYRLRTLLQVNPRFQVELGYRKSNLSHEPYAEFKYQLADGFTPSPKDGKDKNEKSNDISNKLLQKVKRDNNIKTETYTRFVNYKGNIRVTVTNSTNFTPLVGAVVQAYQNGVVVGIAATTDASGNAVISGLPVGTYTVYVTYSTYSAPPSSPITVTKDQTAAVAVSLAVSGGNAAITIINSQSQPVSGASVTADMSNGAVAAAERSIIDTILGVKKAYAGSSSFSVTLTTDASGVAEFTNLPPGTYIFTVRKGSLDIKSQSVTIAETGTNKVTLILPNSGGVISASVQDASKNRLNGATVNVLSGNGIITAGKTDSNGVVLLGGIDAGKYTLSASLQDYASITQDVTVTSGMTTGSNITLTRDTGTPTVAVTFSDGATNVTPVFTLDGAATITGTAGTPTINGTTSTIIYTFSNLTTGDHTIAATATNYTSSGTSSVKVSKGTATAGTGITLTHDNGNATIAVTFSDGATNVTPVFKLDGTTTITGTAGTPTTNGTTSTITYTFNNLTTGDHTIAATATGYTGSGVSSVKVSKGTATAGTGITLTRDNGNATIAVTFSDGATNVTPVFTLDGTTTITGTAGTPTASGTTSTIIYTFSNLTTGDHTIAATATGYTSSGTSSVNVSKGTTTAGTGITLTRDAGYYILPVEFDDGELNPQITFKTTDGQKTFIAEKLETTVSSGTSSIKYKIINIPTGDYNIVAEVPYYVCQGFQQMTIVKGGLESMLPIRMKAVGTVMITAKNYGDLVLKGCNIKIVNTATSTSYQAQTSESGNISFNTLPLSTYEVSIQDAAGKWVKSETTFTCNKGVSTPIIVFDLVETTFKWYNDNSRLIYMKTNVVVPNCTFGEPLDLVRSKATYNYPFPKYFAGGTTYAATSQTGNYWNLPYDNALTITGTITSHKKRLTIYSTNSSANQLSVQAILE